MLRPGLSRRDIEEDEVAALRSKTSSTAETAVGGTSMPSLVMVRVRMEDVVLDPSPMVVRFITRSANRTGDGSGRDRRPNLDERAFAPMTTRFEIVAILCDADARAAGWTGELTCCRSGAHPFSLVDQSLVALPFVMAM